MDNQGWCYQVIYYQIRGGCVRVLELRKNGEVIIENTDDTISSAIEVYEPSSGHISGSEQPYSPSPTRPTDYPSTSQYKPSAGNGSVPAPVPESAPVASQSYQYDSNYQLPLRRLQRHKGQQGLLLEHRRLMTFSLL
nr:hypothetical protein [Tanacetum cinerariifolium]